MNKFKSYENVIFNIAKDINESYPSFFEDHGAKHREVDKEEIIHLINKHSDFRIDDKNAFTMINKSNESISYKLFEEAIYNMVYHQICNLGM